jgi:cation transport regulator ChaC
MEAHELEREDVLRLTDEDTTDTLTFLEEINDNVDFVPIELQVSTERKVEESPVGKTTNPLFQEVEHLGAKGFQDQDSNKLLSVSKSS